VLNRRRYLQLAAASALAPPLGVAAARAQTIIFPGHSVYLVIPFAPAGGADVIGRLLGARLADMWGQPVVIENRSGAGGNIAADQVARADPDGYTLFFASIGHAINKFMFPSLTYDPVADFAPVSLVCTYGNIMVVPVSSPARTVQEFIEHAKANPGRIDVMFATASSALPLIQAGRLRGLAVTSLERQPWAPDLPTVAESGLSGFEVSSWYGVFAPAKTPPEIVGKISADIASVVHEADFVDALTRIATTPIGSTPEGLARHLKAEMEKWGPVITEARIRVAE